MVTPSDPDAERLVIGQCLRSTDSFTYAFDRLEETAFTGERNRELWRVMTRLWHEEAPVNPASVSLLLDRPPDWLDRAATVPHSAFVIALDRVVECWRRQRVATMASDLMYGALDREVDLARLVGAHIEALDQPELSIETTTPPVALPEFLATTVDYRWLVPNLLERGDRLLLTGGEGGGKSVLLRQWACQMALGIDPITFQPHDVGPARVLYLDCENSVVQTQRVFRAMLKRSGHEAPSTLFLEVRPQGMDLLSAPDQRWLTSKVAAVKPDLITGGPLYKLFLAGPEDEQAARALAGYLDRLRRRYDCAVMLEAHSPHGFAGDRAGLRPFGSSLWLRWPEFGFGMQQTKKGDRTKMNFIPWRGLRDQRAFPDQLEWDDNAPGHWLWVPRRGN